MSKKKKHVYFRGDHVPKPRVSTDHSNGAGHPVSTCLPQSSVKVRTKILILSSLPNNKIVDSSNLKAFADDKIFVTEKLKFVL